MKFLSLSLAAGCLSCAAPAFATTTLHSLAGGNFSQDWSNTALISTNNDWSGVPSVVGYRGDDLTTVTATDPQTILTAETIGVVNVLPNQTNPNTLTTGAVAEFDTLADPTIAFQGSGTADAPYLMLYMDATGVSSVTVSYDLRDIDGSADNAAQQVALQYRVGGTGDFVNLSTGYVADASTGPNLDTLVTPVSVTLPAAANNASILEIRIMTTNAIGSDEWVGIDNIQVTSVAVPEAGSAVMGLAALGLLATRRRR